MVDTGAVRYRLEVVPVSLRCYNGHRCCEYRLEVVPEVLWWTQVLWGTVLRLSLCLWGVMVDTGSVRYRLDVVPEVLWLTQVLGCAVLKLSLCPWGVMVDTGAVRYRLEVVLVSLRCYGGHRFCEVPSWSCPCVPEVVWWTQVLWGTVLKLSLCPWGVMVDTGSVRYRLEVVPVSVRCYGGHRFCEVPSWCCPWGVMADTGSVRYRLEVVPVYLRCYGGHRFCEVPSWGRPCVPEVLWWTQVLWSTVLRLSLCLWGVMVDTGLWDAVLRLSPCPWCVMLDTGAVRYRLEVVPVSLRCYSGHRCCEVPSWGRPCVPDVL